MDELAVEIVEEIHFDAPQYVLYGGKGGVGKTTMAAATALASALDGVDTVVVSTDPAHSLSDMFEQPVSAEPTLITDHLYAVEIDPDKAMDETAFFDEGGSFGGLGGIEDLIGDFGGEEGIGSAMPGVDEAAAMQQLLVYLDDDRFDRVVVDTAPTGHTLRLLELPEVMDTMVGRILRLRERVSGIMESVTGLFRGEESAEDASASMDDLRTLREQIERLRDTLRDPSLTDFRIVLVPEVMSVKESSRLLERMDDFGIPVNTIVVNRVMEDFGEITGIEYDLDVVAPNPDHCEFCRRRWKVQENALLEAQELFRTHTVKRVPLLSDEIQGIVMLRLVAACLSSN